MERELMFAARLLSATLYKENPSTIGLILSYLDATMAAAVFGTLSEETQTDVICSVARFEGDAAQALKAMEETSAPELKTVLREQAFSGVGGVRAVAEILRRVDRSTETAAMEHLSEQDAEMAEAVHGHLIAFSDIERLTAREIQMLLREVDMKDLAVALKGGSKELQDRVFSSVSEEDANKIREEMELTGPVRVSDVDPMQLRIVQAMRRLEDAGQITAVRCSEEPFL